MSVKAPKQISNKIYYNEKGLFHISDRASLDIIECMK